MVVNRGGFLAVKGLDSENVKWEERLWKLDDRALKWFNREEPHVFMGSSPLEQMMNVQFDARKNELNFEIGSGVVRIRARTKEEAQIWYEGVLENIRALASPVTNNDVEGAASPNSVDCSVCMVPICPPIFQCTRGHLHCHQCLSALELQLPALCCVCNEQLPPRNARIRNHAAEAVSATMTFACPYSHLGCPSVGSVSRMTAHRDICLFGPFRCGCPESSCMWEGCGDAVDDHLAKDRHSKVSKAIASGVLGCPVKQAFFWPRNSPQDVVIKVDGRLILRGISVEERRYVFEVSTLCNLTEEATARHLQYELLFGTGDEAILFEGSVPMKGNGKHCVYVYFDQVQHMVRSANDVLPQAQKKDISQPNAERLLGFSHKFQFYPQ